MLRSWLGFQVVTGLAAFQVVAAAEVPPPRPGLPLYESGRDGFHTYRIPSLLVTPRGTLLAFAEGRKGGSGDAGDIDLLVLSQRIGLRERLRLLMRLEDRLGAQRIDLVVKPALDDPFARMASAEGVRL